MIKYLISALIALTGIGGATYYFGADTKEKITLDNPQRIEWQKPTTDAEWAEDVKKESLDIKSTKKLEEMRDTHAAKLKRMIEGSSEVFECRECIEFSTRKTHPDWSEGDIDNYYNNQLLQATWEIEKLQQSIERMDNELRLRGEGFVLVDGEKKSLFGSIANPYAVRTPRD